MNDTTQSQAGAPKCTVLVLEDDAIVAMDLAMQVEELGYTVMGPFHDAQSASEMISQGLPDAAILDYNLGHDDTSREIAEQLINARVPVTFLSGYSGDDLLGPDYTGTYDILPKPIAQTDLMQRLAQMVDRTKRAL
jgi:CheY-like chemotaxis protein